MKINKTCKNIITPMTLALVGMMSFIGPAKALDMSALRQKAADQNAAAQAATNNLSAADTNALALNDTNAITTNKVFGTTYDKTSGNTSSSTTSKGGSYGSTPMGGARAGLVDKSLVADPYSALAQSVATELNTTITEQSTTARGMKITDFADKKYELTWNDAQGPLHVVLYNGRTKEKEFMGSEDQTGAKPGEIRGTLISTDSKGKTTLTGFFNTNKVLYIIPDENRIIVYTAKLNDGTFKIITDNQQQYTH